jgi:hypothetical protein
MSETEKQQTISLEHIKQEHKLRVKRRYRGPVVIVSLLIVLVIAYVVYDTWSLLYP